MTVPGLVGIDADPRIAHAIDVVRSDYLDIVSVAAKNKDLRKWGFRTTVGTGIEALLTTQGSETEETLLSTNGITREYAPGHSGWRDTDAKSVNHHLVSRLLVHHECHAQRSGEDRGMGTGPHRNQADRRGLLLSDHPMGRRK